MFIAACLFNGSWSVCITMKCKIKKQMAEEIVLMAYWNSHGVGYAVERSWHFIIVKAGKST